MSHMVIFRGPDGKPGYHQTDDIHDAVTFVEQLRNDQGVEQARIFRLEEITFEYRPYYRVELTTGEPALSSVPNRPAVASPAPTAAQPPVADAETSSSDDTPAESEPAAPSPVGSSAPSPVAGDAEDAGVGARRGLFGR